MSHTPAAANPVPALITALSGLLLRACEGAAQPGDADQGRVLSRRLVEVGAPAEILAVATGGVWAAYRPDDEIDDETLSAIADVTRLFLSLDHFDGMVALASATLVLMARRGFTDDPGKDLLRAGQAAWELEHHVLALSVCREALASQTLGEFDRATALTFIDRITRAPGDITRLEDARVGWPAEEGVVVDSRSLFPEGRADDRWLAARDATIAGDRPRAARLMAEVTRELRASSARDHSYLDGLVRAFEAMAGDDVDVPGLRSGLIVVVRQLRQRQRFGNVPPAVRAALELVVLVLKCSASEATGSILCELLEALADAGLSEVTVVPSDAGPAEAEARLVEGATEFQLWPDLAECVAGLEGNFGMLCRRMGGGQSSAERWISLFIVPPTGVLIKDGPLQPDHVAVLDAFGSGDQDLLGSIRPEQVEGLLEALVHSDGVRRLRAEPRRGLVVVPDGPLWTVPWQAAPTLQTRPTSLVPSLTMYAGLHPLPAGIRSISALVDDQVDGADLLIDELMAARAAGLLVVDFAPASLGRETDLLLILGHGVGDGLRFRLALPGGRLSAQEIATRSCSQTALIASCWSAKAPPVTIPLNLPVSLLVGGASCALGGAWALPQRPTAELLASCVRALARGCTLHEGLALGRHAPLALADEWGLMATGRIPPWAAE